MINGGNQPTNLSVKLNQTRLYKYYDEPELSFSKSLSLDQSLLTFIQKVYYASNLLQIFSRETVGLFPALLYYSFPVIRFNDTSVLGGDRVLLKADD